jgi:hypothetical protein
MAFDPKNRPGSADHDVFALNREVEALDDRVTVVESAGGGGGGLEKITFRVTHSGGGGDFELTAAATVQQFDSAKLLPAGAIFLFFREDVEVLAASASVSALTVVGGVATLGLATGGALDHVAGDGNLNDTTSLNPGGLSPFSYEGEPVSVEFTAVGANLSTITAYDATFTLGYIDPGAVSEAP